MKVERADAIQELKLIQVFVDCEWNDLPCLFDERRTKTILIHNRHSQSLHHRTRVLSEALLARDECIPMVQIFLLPLLQVICKSHIMVRTQQQACAFSLDRK